MTKPEMDFRPKHFLVLFRLLIFYIGLSSLYKIFKNQKKKLKKVVDAINVA